MPPECTLRLSRAIGPPSASFTRSCIGATRSTAWTLALVAARWPCGPSLPPSSRLWGCGMHSCGAQCSIGATRAPSLSVARPRALRCATALRASCPPSSASCITRNCDGYMAPSRITHGRRRTAGGASCMSDRRSDRRSDRPCHRPSDRRRCARRRSPCPGATTRLYPPLRPLSRRRPHPRPHRACRGRATRAWDGGHPRSPTSI